MGAERAFGLIAITSTKKGMGPQSRKRDKVLRTYGKRSQPALCKSEEPPTKRRKSDPLESRPEAAASHDKPGTSTSHMSTNKERRPAIEPIESKSSILGYFKRVEKQDVALPEAQESDQESNKEDEVSSPKKPRRKARRILRLRTTNNDGDLRIDDQDLEKENARADTCANTNAEPRVTRKRKPLEATGDGESNRGRRRCPPQQSVQTTLNISSKAAFEECKTCECLWNPLFPPDVQYHQRRHAAILRARAKADGVNL